MSWLRRLRLLATLSLALALALPAYTCTRLVGPDGAERLMILPDEDSAQFRRVTTSHYPLEGQSPGEANFWLLLFAYLWPIPLFAYARWCGGRSMWLRLLEIPLALASAATIVGSVWASFGAVAVGTDVALTANAVLLTVALSELWVLGRASWRARRSAPA